VPGKPTADDVVAWLRRNGKKATRDGMARYALPSDNAFGVSVGAMRAQAKKLGKDHDLAAALWDTGWYEARMMATFVDDPAKVTPAQMERWCKDFDSWGITDTACFALFARSPHAWDKVWRWATRRDEMVRRAAFALLASLVLHDKRAPDERFVESLELVERAASDDRNFVKKAVSWALRTVGKRSPTLYAAAVALSRKLAASPDATPRWLGKDALRDLEGPITKKRMAAKAKAKPSGA